MGCLRCRLNYRLELPVMPTEAWWCPPLAGIFRNFRILYDIFLKCAN